MIPRKPLLLLVLLLPFTLAAQPSPPAGASSPFNLKSLGNGVYAATDDGKGDAGANAGFVIGENGVAVIDTFQKPAAAEAMLAAIRGKTRLPIRFVINTHYHIDHVAGNRLFHDQGAVVLAQRNVRGWIHTENLKFFGKEIAPKDKAAVEDLYGPDLLYDSGVELSLGGEKIVVRSYPGHTGGDSVVIVPGARVIFCGDLFWRKTLPNMIDATVGDWIPTLDALRNLPDAGAATYVPGHGEPGTAADVADFQAYLADLRSLAGGPVREGKEGEALVQAVLPDLQKKYGGWGFFSYFAKPDILNMAAELRGAKTIPRPAAD